MLNRIEIELTRIRRMAQDADDSFLLYLIDMAILEANSAARSKNVASIAANSEFLAHGYSALNVKP